MSISNYKNTSEKKDLIKKITIRLAKYKNLIYFSNL